jgi:hypothetical protein
VLGENPVTMAVPMRTINPPIKVLQVTGSPWARLELAGRPHDEWLLNLRRPETLTQKLKLTTDS